MHFTNPTIYDPLKAERDACGIGFVADARGRSSRAMVDNTLDALMRVRHRGALNADALTGDGAGVLLPLPTDRSVLGVPDPERAGIAMCFLDPVEPSVGRAYVEQACIDEGLAPCMATGAGRRERSRGSGKSRHALDRASHRHPA